MTDWSKHLLPVDMRKAFEQPDEPERYRIERFAQDGALTVLAGQAGSGKSWLGMAMCAAVHSGRPLAGWTVERGTAVYVDGEMGARQAVRRFRAAGYEPDEFVITDSVGLNLGDAAARKEATMLLRKLGANFVVLDSLRRMSPGSKENDSDDMAPLVGGLAVMARELGAAIVLIHHQGHTDGHFARGSTAIADQADAVFGFLVQAPASDGRRKLTCAIERGGKFRLGEEPNDRVVHLMIGTHRGVVVVEDKENATTTHPPLDRVRELREAIPNAVMAGASTNATLAAALGTTPENNSFRAALRAALKDDEVARTGRNGPLRLGGGGGPAPRPETTTTPSPDHVVGPALPQGMGEGQAREDESPDSGSEPPGTARAMPLGAGPAGRDNEEDVEAASVEEGPDLDDELPDPPGCVKAAIHGLMPDAWSGGHCRWCEGEMDEVAA